MSVSLESPPRPDLVPDRNETGSPKISVIIPIFGRLSDLPALIEALRAQTLPPHEIILVDSSDQHLEDIPAGTVYLKNPVDLALSGDYNHAATHATGDCLLLMQQDCLPEDEHTLARLAAALTPERVAVTAVVTLPEPLWATYTFWGQVLMARWVGEFQQGISGKCDLIRAPIFRRIGGYEHERFKFAGEDIDLFMRLSEHGEVFVAPVRVIHNHKQSRRTDAWSLFQKTYQLAESFGALFRKWGFKLRKVPYAGHWTHHISKFLYPAFLLIPFFPLPTLLILIVGSNLALADGFRARSPQKWCLLVLNPLLFTTSVLGTALGFITGVQRYTQNRPVRVPVPRAC